MFGVRPLLFGTVLGGGLMYFAQHCHVVNTADGLIVVPRSQQVGVLDVYADVRGWDAARWTDEPELAAAMTANGRANLMVQETASTLLKKAATGLGISPPIVPENGAAATTMPEIIVRQPEQAATGGKNSVTQSDESLFGRLSRPFASTTTDQQPAKEFQERPMIRERPSPPQNLTPVYPATSPQMDGRDDRAAAPEPLQPTALERIATELGPPDVMPHRYREVEPAAPAPMPFVDEIQIAMPPAGRFEVGSVEEALPERSSRSTPRQELSAGRLRYPLDATAGDFQRPIPDSIGERLRGLLPDPSQSGPIGDLKAY